MAKRAAAVPAGPTRLVDVELGDAEVTVDEFQDGMFEVRVTGDNEPLLANAEQMQAIAAGFVALAKGKGWT